MPKYVVKVRNFVHGGVNYSMGQCIETDSPIEEKHPGQVRLLDDKGRELPPFLKRKKEAEKKKEQESKIQEPEPVFPELDLEKQSGHY